MNITFTPFTLGDMELLRKWLAYPHVKEFWQETDDEQELLKKYTEKLHQRGIQPQLIHLDNSPIGYIQSYQANLVGGGWWPDVCDTTFGMDLFIGEPSYINKGIGVLVIKEFIKGLLLNNTVQEILVDPEPENVRAIRAYENAGFVQQDIIETPNGKAVLMKYFRN